MIIMESLVARTFGTYTPRAFDGDPDSFLVLALGIGLIVFAYLENVSGSRSVGLLSVVMALLKVGGIVLFGAAGLWVSGISFETTGGDLGAGGFLASVALSVLAFKGFTTITNSGAEITAPRRRPGHHSVHHDLRGHLSACRLRRRFQSAVRPHRGCEGHRAGRGSPTRFRADRPRPDDSACAGRHGLRTDRQHIRGLADAGAC